ncbi:hypothetical protein LINPERHAP2_LOCUS28608 [Linum perenne]
MLNILMAKQSYTHDLAPGPRMAFKFFCMVLSYLKSVCDGKSGHDSSFTL